MKLDLEEMKRNISEYCADLSCDELRTCRPQKFTKTKATHEMLSAATESVIGIKDPIFLLVPILGDIATSLAMIVDKIYEEDD